MANYSNLLATIAANIYQNSNNEVTADMVKAAMNAAVSTLGAGYQCLGVADLSTIPPATPDYKAFYVVSTPGTYANFNNLVVNDGEVAIFKWDSTWSKEVTGAANAAEINAVLDIEGVEQTISVFQSNQAINWADGNRVSITGYNIANVITLNKGEGIFFRGVCATNYAAIATNSNSGGWGVPATVKVQGLGAGVRTYYFVADADNTYVQLSYLVASGILAYKVTSTGIQHLYNAIDKNAEDIDAIEELHELATIPVTIGQAVNTSGATYANSRRATTGIIKNESPMLVYIPRGWNAAYMVGDTTTSFTDKGYIISDGGYAVIPDANKYIFFILARTDNEVIDSDANIVIIAAKNGNAVARLMKENYEALMRSSVNIKLASGAWNNNGVRYARANARSADKMEYSFPLIVGCKKGYRVHLVYGGPTYTDAGYITTDGGFAVVDVAANKACFSIMKTDGTTFASTEDCGFWCVGQRSAIGTIGEKAYNTESNLDALVTRLKTDMFTNTTTLTDTDITLAMSDGFDISDKGVLYAGCCGAKNAVREHDGPSWDGYLLVANLADVEKTKRCLLCFPRGATSWSGISNGTIESVQNGIAKVTGADEVTVTAALIWRVGNDEQFSGYVSRKYTPSTDTFASDVEVCKVDVLGTVYELKVRRTIVGGIWTPDAQSIADIEAIWAATGIEHPVGYSGTNSYSYYYGQNPKKYNGEWYLPICLGNFSHALCKTADMINWEFVCDIPFQQSSEECTICFMGTKIYATSRGNYSVDSQYSKIMACEVSELDGSHWTTPIVLTDCKLERPTIESLNGKLYMMQGLGAATTEGVTIARAKKRLYVMDANMDILSQDDLVFIWPILHPQFLQFGGNLWMATSADKRCFAFTASGDTRSEVAFAHIDEHILGL